MTWLSVSSRSSVDRAPARCTGGHGFDSAVSRSCWSVHFSHFIYLFTHSAVPRNLFISSLVCFFSPEIPQNLLNWNVTFIGLSDYGSSEMTPHVSLQIIFCVRFSFEHAQRFQNCTRELFQIAGVIVRDHRILKNTKLTWPHYCSVWQLTVRASLFTAALAKCYLCYWTSFRLIELNIWTQSELNRAIGFHWVWQSNTTQLNSHKIGRSWNTFGLIRTQSLD